MTRLTWQQVAAPNFSTAIDGVHTASNLLERAGTNISTGLANFDNAQQGIADQQIAQQVSQYQDPTQLKNALANGIIGAQLDPSRVSAQALNAAQGRVGTLLNTAINERNLADANYQAGRRLVTDGRIDLLNQRADIDYARSEQNRLDAQAAAKGVRFVQENRTDPGLIREYLRGIESDQVRNMIMAGLGDSYGKLYGADQAMGIDALIPEGVADGSIPAAIASAQQNAAATGARGNRNNNSGNIEFSKSNPWQGQIGSDGRFAIFDTPENGYRAMAKLLVNYQDKYGVDTPRKVIERWAPLKDSGNSKASQDNYIAAVSKQLGINPDDKINMKDPVVLQKLMTGISTFENGGLAHSQDVLGRGVARALGLPEQPATNPAASLTASARPSSGSAPASAAVQVPQTRTPTPPGPITEADTGGLGFFGSLLGQGTPLQRNAYQIKTLQDSLRNVDPQYQDKAVLQRINDLQKERQNLLNANNGVTPAAQTQPQAQAQTQGQFVDNVGSGVPGSDFSQIPLNSSSDVYERALKLAELGASTRKMQNDQFNVASAYRKNVGDERSDMQVANAVVAKGGVLEGIPADRVLPLIREVQRETGVNAATAASVIAQSIDRRSPFWDRVNWNTTNAGESYISKDSNLSAAVRQLKSGQFLETVMANEAMDQSMAELRKHLEKVKLMEQARDKLRVQARSYPDARENLAKIEATLAAYQAVLHQGVSRFAVNQNYQPQR